MISRAVVTPVLSHRAPYRLRRRAANPHTHRARQEGHLPLGFQQSPFFIFNSLSLQEHLQHRITGQARLQRPGHAILARTVQCCACPGASEVTEASRGKVEQLTPTCSGASLNLSAAALAARNLADLLGPPTKINLITVEHETLREAPAWLSGLLCFVHCLANPDIFHGLLGKCFGSLWQESPELMHVLRARGLSAPFRGLGFAAARRTILSATLHKRQGQSSGAPVQATRHCHAQGSAIPLVRILLEGAGDPRFRRVSEVAGLADCRGLELQFVPRRQSHTIHLKHQDPY